MFLPAKQLEKEGYMKPAIIFFIFAGQIIPAQDMAEAMQVANAWQNSTSGDVESCLFEEEG